MSLHAPLAGWQLLSALGVVSTRLADPGATRLDSTRLALATAMVTLGVGASRRHGA
jgi:hypothetical protein